MDIYFYLSFNICIIFDRINGTAIILNHKNFQSRPGNENPNNRITPGTRQGTDKDAQKLRDVLTTYGFSLREETDLTTEQVHLIIQDRKSYRLCNKLPL